MVDARLTDGSRVNAIIPPLSLVGPVITIRKFSASPFTVDDLVRFGTATPDMFDFLRACVEARLNIFVSGGTGSGKTTTLNVLSSFIPNDERIVTIEDAAELQLRQEHVVTLESRPPNIEGKGAIPIRELVRNSLRMRPDRIIVGECRAGEALDMLQAMNTGHDGSMSTGHANSPRDMLSRLETMVLMAGVDLRSAPSASRSPRRSTSSSSRAASRTGPGRSSTSPRSRAWKATSSSCRTSSSSSRPASSKARSRAA
jgi:pilus assembly protein CpaF